MRLVYKNPVELGKIFSAISVIISEVNLDFNEEGLSIFGLDNGHVSMIFMKLSQSDCIEYECEEPIRLGINLKTLTSILNTGKDSDNVILENVEKDALNIIIKNENRKIEYEIKLMEIMMENLDIPYIEYSFKLVTTAGYFYSLLESIAVVLGDEVKVKIEGSKMVISGSGQLGNSKIELELNVNKKEYELIGNGEELEQAYALILMMKSKKLGEVSKRIEVNLAQDIPIEIKYKIGENSEIRFMLAPKIDE
jgi:proliferating cell nuclear antigen PCNA